MRIFGPALLVLLTGVSPGCRSRSKAEAPAPGEILDIDYELQTGAVPCPAPLITIDEAGAHVYMYPSNGLFGKGVPAAYGTGSLWAREVVRAAGVCPSVPRQDGSLDLPALTSLLRQIVAERPRCPRASTNRLLEAINFEDRRLLIAASPSTPVREVMAVADAAAAAGLRGVRLELYGDPTPDCADAITPVDLRYLQLLEF